MAPHEGGFAKYIAMPEVNLVTIPDDIALSIAALVEQIACGWHAMRKAKSPYNKKDKDIRALVIGGGAICLGAAISCSAQGVKGFFITYPNVLRREYIEKHCAQRVTDP